MLSEFSDLRIAQHPYLKFERGERVKIKFDGRELDAYQNESLGAALYASGVRIFSRSEKYHRPRGLFCVSGRCASCMLRVDGVPNVRVCAEPVHQGAIVESQNSYPNVSHDIYSILNHLGFLFPVGFQYKFVRPRFMWRVAEKVIKRMAGYGKIPDENAHVSTRYPPLNVLNKVDVAVVGGGPAGLCAATTAARNGAHVALFDENDYLGGHVMKQTAEYDSPEYPGLRGFEIAKRMQEEAKAQSNLEIYQGTTAVGFYEGGKLAVNRGESYVELTPKATILAPGAYERRLIFENNDLPGIISGSGVQTLMHIHGIRPGRQVVVASTDGLGPELAIQLAEAGASVPCVIESRVKRDDEKYFAKLKELGVPVLWQYEIKSAHGKAGVGRVTVVKVAENGDQLSGTEKTIACDSLCVSAGYAPAFELLYQIGSDMYYDRQKDGFFPKRSNKMEVAPGIFAAGHVYGTHSLGSILLEGRIAGTSASLLLGYGGSDAETAMDYMIDELSKMA